MPLTIAEKYVNICNLTAEQRKEAHTRAMEILLECKSGTPEWEPVCEPVPLPDPFEWQLCAKVALPPIDMPNVPKQAEDIVQVYQAPVNNPLW